MASSRTTVDTALKIGILLLTLGTAITHLQLNFPDPVFMLNGLGYLTLLAALYLPIPQLDNYRSLVRWAFVGYTALTIFLWVLIGERTPIGYVNKLNELVLISLLLVEVQRSRF